jgi:hypothetical protein
MPPLQVSGVLPRLQVNGVLPRLQASGDGSDTSANAAMHARSPPPPASTRSRRHPRVTPENRPESGRSASSRAVCCKISGVTRPPAQECPVCRPAETGPTRAPARPSTPRSPPRPAGTRSRVATRRATPENRPESGRAASLTAVSRRISGVTDGRAEREAPAGRSTRAGLAGELGRNYRRASSAGGTGGPVEGCQRGNSGAGELSSRAHPRVSAAARRTPG